MTTIRRMMAVKWAKRTFMWQHSKGKAHISKARRYKQWSRKAIKLIAGSGTVRKSTTSKIRSLRKQLITFKLLKINRWFMQSRITPIFKLLCNSNSRSNSSSSKIMLHNSISQMAAGFALSARTTISTEESSVTDARRWRRSKISMGSQNTY